jgi:MFS family permease
MDQNFKAAGQKITSVLLGFCAFITGGLSLGFLFSYPDPIWWLGLLLLGSAALLIAGIVGSSRRRKKETKADQQLLATLKQPDKATVLADWLYSSGEWNSFLKWERKERGSNTVIEGLAIVLFGGALLHFTKNAGWPLALSISAVVGALYAVIKYNLAMSSIKAEKSKPQEVIIMAEAVLINGKLNRFYGDNLWLGGVEIKDAGELNVMEITFCWNTRGGKTFDEIRFPVPKGRLREAIKVQEQLMETLVKAG